MSAIVKFENLEALIIELRGQSALLDSDVAELYGVETKRINEAVKNNPDKFPQDYMVELSREEFQGLRSKISTAKLTKTRVPPQSLYRERPIYDRYDIEKPPGNGGHICDHRNICKNSRTIKEYQVTFHRQG